VEKMAASKIAITIDESMLKQIDMLVKSKYFPNRSKAIQQAVSEKLMRLEKNRLAHECAKLDPKFEQSIAEEGLSVELEEWPEY
jgi:Arc/MetJ-type ribon-helix-helix transcriptional regulator